MSNKKDKKKGSNSKEFLNVVPFKTKSLKDQKIETEYEIWEKMDLFSRELVKAYKEKTHKESIDHDHCWYIFYYRVMQEMMLSQMSYPAFKYYITSTSRQLLKQHKEFTNSFDEYNSNSEDEEDIFGRSKIIKKDKTLH